MPNADDVIRVLVRLIEKQARSKPGSILYGADIYEIPDMVESETPGYWVTKSEVTLIKGRAPKDCQIRVDVTVFRRKEKTGEE